MTTAHNGWQQEIMQHKQRQIIILFVIFQVLGDTNWPDTNWPTQPGSLEVGERTWERGWPAYRCLFKTEKKKLGEKLCEGDGGWLCIV